MTILKTVLDVHLSHNWLNTTVDV